MREDRLIEKKKIKNVWKMDHEKGNDALVASLSLFVFFTGSKIYVSQGWHKKLSSLENPYVDRRSGKIPGSSNLLVRALIIFQHWRKRL